MHYDYKKIEKKWRRVWEEQKLFHSIPQGIREKLYLLFAFPYPSGSGLHVGHVESMTALDILARYNRMQGKDVFLPIGWDAFGLPAENYAIKTGVPPVETTKKAIATFTQQIKDVGISFTWDHELATCDPDYYRWTQWLFLKLYEKGLAYKKPGTVNWCPDCQTVLANEQVVNGLCERSDTPVVQKEMEQWFFKITDYKDELISGLNEVDWPKATKEQQVNWIGKKEGAKVSFMIDDFLIDGQHDYIDCFTTRVDTIFGVTFVVISPEAARRLIEKGWRAPQNVMGYIDQAFKKTEEERRIGEKEKTGVAAGFNVESPVSGDEIPVWVADYVLNEYGTGAVMGVPAHDERDGVFAEKFGLPVRQVIADGVLVNSGKYDGLNSESAIKQLLQDHPRSMQTSVQYKLRDWLISRQRYWGAPIPIVYDPQGKPHPVKEEHLPWMLPTDVEFKPTGESPLTHSKEFKARVEKLYGKSWRPEYDTMDTFVDSSWYFLRYPTVQIKNSKVKNEEFPFDAEITKAWLPADFYMIGPEHIVLHLLYARFFTKFLRDQGYLNFGEPFPKMRHQGIIMGPDGKRMSKSHGNVINPDDVIADYGADTLRLYEMFLGPIEASKPWNVQAIAGLKRFLERVYRLLTEAAGQSGAKSDAKVDLLIHKTLKQVGEDIEALKFNTAISSLMKMMNELESVMRNDKIDLKSVSVLSNENVQMIVKMIAPLAPFMAEDLWQTYFGSKGKFESVHTQAWPNYDESKTRAETVTVVVQVNGKMRSTLVIDSRELPIGKEAMVVRAQKDDKVARWLEGKEIKQVIWIEPKEGHQGLVNLVVS